jgi:AcrR family transcriptional regulator
LPYAQTFFFGKSTPGAVSWLLVKAPEPLREQNKESLRERKKAATRQALHKAVLRMAVARGFDAVTLDAVADEANVSRRTFSNYFANKEEALLYGERVRVGRLLDEVRGQPAEVPAWTALRQATRTVFSDLDGMDATWLSQIRLVRRHPSLLAYQIATQSALEQDLADEIAKRSGDADHDPARHRVMAATFLAALRTGLTIWCEQPTARSLSITIDHAMEIAAQSFTGPPGG